MKIIKQSHSAIEGLNPLEHIEKIIRVCYKSEEKIEDGSAEKFVNMIRKNNHHAMLEHYRFIMHVPEQLYQAILLCKRDHIEMTRYNNRFIISCNAIALQNIRYITDDTDTSVGVELTKLIDFYIDGIINDIIGAYGCGAIFGREYNSKMMKVAEFIPNALRCMTVQEYTVHGWKSVHFITDRGITHEIVRHRENTSYAQESTRYCNYGLDKFGREISVIDQGFDEDSIEFNCWQLACQHAESEYFNMLDVGIKPQMARSVLPTCLKTEIVVTAPMYEWQHILDLRVHGTTGAPHPMIKLLMQDLVEELGVNRYENSTNNN